MKKNRPGVLLSVTCSRAQAETLAALIFAETTTIGLRRQEVQRWALARERVEVETPYGIVGVKVARLGGKVMTASPEHEDCRHLALESGVPLKEVYVEAEVAFRKQMDLFFTLPKDLNDSASKKWDRQVSKSPTIPTCAA